MHIKTYIIPRKHLRGNKTRGQAMVEFMLALPLLLLLIYGTLEVARLIFVFSSVANASRQAAKFGAGAGEINNVAFYQDCDAIRDVAESSAIIVDFDEVNITYDRGVNQNGTQIPISDINPNPDFDSCPVEDDMIRNGDRIIVQVSASYEPILSIIPIDPIKVVSANAKTFLISVPVVGSAMPQGFSAETPTPSQIPTLFSFTNTPTIIPTLTKPGSPGGGGVPPKTATSITPFLTFTPVNTAAPTRIPSITPSPISCTGLKGVSHGPLVINGNFMEMEILNNTDHLLSTAQIYVEWNHDTGHKDPANSTLHLKRSTLEDQNLSVDVHSPSAYIDGFYPFIPIGESKIMFMFDQVYDVPDGTERIIITISTPGCVNYPVDSRD